MGGAIEGVLRLGDAYRALGHEQHLLTLDDPGDPWVAQCPSPVVALGRTGPTKRFYPARAINWLRANLSQFDGVVVDGLWNASTLAAARVLPAGQTPYCVFPHGMLDPWFRKHRPRKEWLKRQLFRVNERRLLRSARAVLFTAEQERQLARNSWPGWSGITEQVVGFGTGDPPHHEDAMDRAANHAVPGIKGLRYLLFLSRLHPKKGLEILLDGFAAAHGAGELRLVIAGPGDPAYVMELQERARALGIGERVDWPGMLSGDAKWGILYNCEALVLSSYQENFGVVVAEALACRRPVIVSDQVNIHDDIASRRAGLVCTATVAGVADTLDALSQLDPGAMDAMGARGRSLFLERFDMCRVAERILAQFL